MSETNDVVVSTVLAGAAAWAFKDLHNYFYATMTFILHFFYGVSEACSILFQSQEVRDSSVFLHKVTQNLGLPLIATEVCLKGVASRWLSYVNLVVPMIDTSMFLTSNEEFNPELLAVSKIVSVMLIALMAYRSETSNPYGYLLAAIWFLAESSVISVKDLKLLYPAFCAAADLLANSYFTGRNIIHSNAS